VAAAGVGALAFVSLLAVGISVAASSLAAVPDHPEVSGGAWDGFLLVDPSDPAVEEALAGAPDVTAHGVGGWSVLEAQGQELPTLFLPDSMAPAIASGSAPRADDEIALGAQAMRRLGVRTGDHLAVSFPGTDVPPRELTVTGETITAAPLFISFAPDDAAVAGFDMPEGLFDPPPGELVQLARDAGDPQQVLERVVADMPDGSVFFAFARARRGDVVALEELEGLIRAVLVMVAALALASLVHQVLVTHRRNASEVGVLRAIGFTRADVAEAGAAHGGALAAVTAVVAVPLGVAAGSTAWRFLADELVVLPRTRYDLAPIIGVALAVVVVAAALASLLARRSARRPVARALRAE
jgi:ABC-type lipoprotein release transport system permease subunit